MPFSTPVFFFFHEEKKRKINKKREKKAKEFRLENRRQKHNYCIFQYLSIHSKGRKGSEHAGFPRTCNIRELDVASFDN